MFPFSRRKVLCPTREIYCLCFGFVVSETKTKFIDFKKSGFHGSFCRKEEKVERITSLQLFGITTTDYSLREKREDRSRTLVTLTYTHSFPNVCTLLPRVPTGSGRAGSRTCFAGLLKEISHVKFVLLSDLPPLSNDERLEPTHKKK